MLGPAGVAGMSPSVILFFNGFVRRLVCTLLTLLRGSILYLATHDFHIFPFVLFFSFLTTADESGASVSAEQVMAKVAEVNQMLSGFVPRALFSFFMLAFYAFFCECSLLSFTWVLIVCHPQRTR